MAVNIAVLFVDRASTLVVATLTLTVQIFVGWHTVFMKPFTVSDVLVHIGLVLISFFYLSLLSRICLLSTYLNYALLRARASDSGIDIVIEKSEISKHI